MICPKCRFEQADGNVECARCGIIFAKFLAALKQKPLPGPGPLPSSPAEPERSDRLHWAREFLCPIEAPVNPWFVTGRAIVYVGLVVWGWTLMRMPMETNDVGESFMHAINLPFHEAGHLFFAPFGRFMHVLGGTLGQLLMPTICMAALLIKSRDGFGASVGLWWVAENFMDIAPYINDARALDLILLGGVTGKEVEDYHDWENILGLLGWLPYDHAIAQASYRLGILLMILAWAWGGYVLALQFRHRDSAERCVP